MGCKFEQGKDFYFINENKIKKVVSAGFYDNWKDTVVICMMGDEENKRPQAVSESDCFDTFDEIADFMRKQCEELIADSKRDIT
mgnify:CR=1 FL=1